MINMMVEKMVEGVGREDDVGRADVGYWVLKRVEW